ncbi:MAG: amidohydrolase family protein [Desulfurococcaceae archaeon]|nr:amidohydrolase family protein [Desulfurococcaceae archaeon]
MQTRGGRVIALVNSRVFTAAEPRRVIENGVVVIRDGIITDIGTRGSVEVPEGAEVLDLKGLFVMPGLIDAHAHLSGCKTGDFVKEPLLTPYEVLIARAVKELEVLVNAGYTTFVDAGGLIGLRLKYAVEEGTLVGPRIVAAGPPISQTFGHGDIHYIPVEYADIRTTRKLFSPFAGVICDGVDECRKAARYVLREGADFIKIMASGGVLSERDRPEFRQFTVDEIKAIVEEARACRTFVHAHSYSSEGIRNAIVGGVKVVAHASFIDEEGIELAKEGDVVVVPTTAVYVKILEEGPRVGFPEWGLRKAEEVFKVHCENIRRAYRYGVKIAAGSDFIGGPFRHGENALEVKVLVEKVGMAPEDALVAATRVAAEVAGLHHKTGTLERGKYADIIAVRGDPVSNVDVITRPENVVLVMKEGRILKNLLESW